MSLQPKLSKSNLVMTRRASATSYESSTLGSTVSASSMLDQISDIDDSEEEGRSSDFCTPNGSLEHLADRKVEDHLNTITATEPTVNNHIEDIKPEANQCVATLAKDNGKQVANPHVGDEKAKGESIHNVLKESSINETSQQEMATTSGDRPNTNVELAHGDIDCNTNDAGTGSGEIKHSSSHPNPSVLPVSSLASDEGQECLGSDTKLEGTDTSATEVKSETKAGERDMPLGYVRPEARGVSSNSDLLMALNNSLGLRSLREYCLRGAHMLRECARQKDEMQSGLMYLAHGKSKHRHATAVLPFESDTVHEGQMVITHGPGSAVPHRLEAPPCGLEFSAELKSGTGASPKAKAAIRGSVTPMWTTNDITAVLNELVNGIGGSTQDMKANVGTHLPRLNEMLSRILQWDTTQFAGPVVKDKRTNDTYSSINFVTKLDHKEIHKRYPNISSALKFMAHVRLVVTDLHGIKKANLNDGVLRGIGAHTLVHIEFNTDTQTVTMKAFKKGGKLLWSTNGGLTPCVDKVGAPLNKAGGYRYFNHDLGASPDLFILADINAALAFGLDFHLPTVALRLTSGYRNMTGLNVRLLKMFPTWATTLASFVVDIDGLFADLQKTFLLNLTIQTKADAIAAIAKEKAQYEEQAEIDRKKAEALAAQRERRRSSLAAGRSRSNSNGSSAAHWTSGTHITNVACANTVKNNATTNTVKNDETKDTAKNNAIRETATGATRRCDDTKTETGKRGHPNVVHTETSSAAKESNHTHADVQSSGSEVTDADRITSTSTVASTSIKTNSEGKSGAVSENLAAPVVNSSSDSSKADSTIGVEAQEAEQISSLRDKVCVESGASPMVLTFAFDAAAPTTVFASIFQRVWDKLVDKLLWVEIFSYLDDLNTNVAEDCAIGINSGDYT